MTRTYIFGDKNNKLVCFPQVHGQLIASLIASDFSRLGWCQLPSERKWPTFLGPGSKPGLERLVEKQGLHVAELIVMVERVMKKLQEDLSPEKVKELRVDHIYMEHAFCRV
jgi:hypothetical protein